MSVKVLVLGGYGFFGSRLARRLAERPDFEIHIAGRSLARAQAFASELQALPASVHAAALDADAPDLASRLREFPVQVLVNASGPFQHRDYSVARACIACGVHYIDLADGREFVNGIVGLDDEAKRAGVCVISGASSVPALSAAVVDRLAQGFAPTHIDIGIHPGNRTERGVATIAGVLSYCGENIPIWREGKRDQVAGWSKHWPHVYPQPVGRRWTTHCDVPDLALFPTRYPGVRSVRFGAGLELGFLHGGLALLAWLRRLRLLPRLDRYAPQLKGLSDWFRGQGSDAGGMYVDVLGKNDQGRAVRRTWHLIAEQGDGPYVPTLAAHALLLKFARAEVPAPGARPCVGLLSLDDFKSVVGRLSIRMD